MINYCIIAWDSEELKWNILYYDTDFDRAERLLIKYKRTHSHCQLMVNAFSIKKEDAKKELLETIERIQRNAKIRREQMLDSKSRGAT